MASARCPRISSSSSRSSGRMALVLRSGSGVHDAADRRYQLRPATLLSKELCFARRGEPVVLRFLVRLADTPFGLQPAALLEPVQRRIQRARFDLEQLFRLRADRLADPMPVL